VNYETNFYIVCFSRKTASIHLNLQTPAMAMNDKLAEILLRAQSSSFVCTEVPEDYITKRGSAIFHPIVVGVNEITAKQCMSIVGVNKTECHFQIHSVIPMRILKKKVKNFGFKVKAKVVY
jgi:hypothetical protein